MFDFSPENDIINDSVIILGGVSVERCYISHSPEETEMLGKMLADELTADTVIALEGGMGMGKTCFVRGLAEGLGFKGETFSPTFAIVNEYIGGRLTLYHFDMYRVENLEDLYSTGFFDYLETGAVLAIEWSENIASALPEDTLEIRFERVSDNERKITFGR